VYNIFFVIVMCLWKSERPHKLDVMCREMLLLSPFSITITFIF